MAIDKVIPQQLNYDADVRYLKPNEMRDALNVRAFTSAAGDSLVIENIPSNVQVTYALPTGTNRHIGNIRHSENNDIYYFIWNSGANHQIIKYNSISNSCRLVLQSNLLRFTKTAFIQGFAITAQDAKDTLLYYSDNVVELRKINVSRAILHTDGDYVNGYPNPLVKEYIELIKYPPLYKPTFAHQKDPSVVYNNLADEVFQFSYRYVHKDGERTAYSPYSEVSFSEYQKRNGVFQSQSSDLVYNYLEVLVNNSWNDVDKIEVVARKGDSGEWFLIKTLDNDPTSQTQSFSFYNDDTYSAANAADVNKLFDYIPFRAKAIEYISNRMVLMNGVDGFNNIDQDELNNKTSFGIRYGERQVIESTPIQVGTNFVINASDVSFTIPMSSITPSTGDYFTINFRMFIKDGNLTVGWGDFYATYTASASGSISDVVNNLALQLDGLKNNDLEITSAVNNSNNIDLVVKYNNAAVTDSQITLNNSNHVLNYQSEISLKAGAKHPVAIVYYDFANRNSTAQKPVNNAPYVKWISERNTDLRRGKASMDVRIGYKPPVWATHYRLVYGGNSSVLPKIQYTVTAAYTNINNVGGAGDTNLYIPINTLKGGSDDDAHGDAYIPSTGALPDYKFSEGDRLRIISYVPFGSTNGEDDRVYANEYLDFKVVDLKYFEKDTATNPIYSTGSKNAYGWTLVVEDPNRDDEWSHDWISTNPDASNNTNWFVKNQGANGHGSSALIELYNPRDRNVENVFYETGYAYEIENAGLTTRRHKAERNQDENYSILIADILAVESTTDSVIVSPPEFKYYIGDVVQFVGGTGSPVGDYTITDILKSNSALDTYQVFFDKSLAGVSNGSELGDIVLAEAFRYAAFTFDEGDIWLKPRKLITGKLDNDSTTIRTVFYDVVEDYYANDFFVSNFWKSKGRPQAYSEYAKQETRKATAYISEPYFPDTNSNGFSSFNLATLPFIDYDRSFGAVQAIKRRDNRLIVWQENKVSFLMSGEQTIKTADDGNLQTVTSEILQDRLQPYAGDYGIGFDPESLADYNGKWFWVDIKRGKVCRLGGDGITTISDFGVSKLLDELSRDYLSVSTSGGFKIYGGFNREFEEYVITFAQVESSNIEVNATPSNVNTINVTEDATNIYLTAPTELSEPLTVPILDVPTDTEIERDVINLTQFSERNRILVSELTLTEDLNDIPLTIRFDDQSTDITGFLNKTSSTITIDKSAGGNTIARNSIKTISPISIVFSEKSKTWSSRVSHISEGYAGVNYSFFSFDSGNIWKHDSGGDYNNFYGSQFDSLVSVVLNQSPSNVKCYDAISLEGTDAWDCEMETNLTESSFSSVDMDEREGFFYVSTKGDTLNGGEFIGLGQIDDITGDVITIKGYSPRDIFVGDNIRFDDSFSEEITNINGNQLTLSSTFGLTVDDFVYVVKDGLSDGDQVRGYYLKIDLTKRGDTFTELFAVNGIVKDSKYTNS